MRNRWVGLLVLLAFLFFLEGLCLKGIIVLTSILHSTYKSGVFGGYYLLTSLQFFCLLLFGVALQTDKRVRAYKAMAWFTVFFAPKLLAYVLAVVLYGLLLLTTLPFIDLLSAETSYSFSEALWIATLTLLSLYIVYCWGYL